MIGVEATVIGLGLRGGSLGLEPELSVMTGCRSSMGALAGVAPAGSGSLGLADGAPLAKTSLVVAAAISLAVITSTSSRFGSSGAWISGPAALLPFGRA